MPLHCYRLFRTAASSSAEMEKKVKYVGIHVLEFCSVFKGRLQKESLLLPIQTPCYREAKGTLELSLSLLLFQLSSVYNYWVWWLFFLESVMQTTPSSIRTSLKKTNKIYRPKIRWFFCLFVLLLSNVSFRDETLVN